MKKPEEGGVDRGPRGEAAHLGDGPVVGALVDDADAQEQGAGDDAVGDHLHDGALRGPAAVNTKMPSVTKPMWLTELYATSFLRSGCTMATMAP